MGPGAPKLHSLEDEEPAAKAGWLVRQGGKDRGSRTVEVRAEYFKKEAVSYVQCS